MRNTIFSKLKFRPKNDDSEILCFLDKNEQGFVEHYIKDAEYFDYFAERKCSATHEDERRLHQTIMRHLPKSQISQHILDIGSGSGWLANNILEKTQNFITCVDISATNLKKIAALHPNNERLALIQAEAVPLPFVAHTFNCVVCSEVIEHLAEPKTAIDEMLRIVAPNGSVIITTPYKEKIKQELCIHCHKLTPSNAHLHSFDEVVLRQICERDNVELQFFIFGNKLLHQARVLGLLSFLPFRIWRFIDIISNILVKKCDHILVKITKKI